MPIVYVNGINLYYEVTGEGFPLVWSHEFAGDRGYPPSDVPTEPTAYSQEQAVEDLYQLLQYLGIQQAYVGGLSMGGNVALNFSISHPDMTKAMVIAATGSGTINRETFESRMEDLAQRLETEGMRSAAEHYVRESNRVQLPRKDLKSGQEFYEGFVSHSAIGSALTVRSIMLKRPAIFTLEPKLQQLTVPTLIMVGDEDTNCIEPALFMKRNIPRSGLVVFPKAGHAINLEEPALFNQTALDFLTSVEAGRW